MEFEPSCEHFTNEKKKNYVKQEFIENVLIFPFFFLRVLTGTLCTFCSKCFFFLISCFDPASEFFKNQ